MLTSELPAGSAPAPVPLPHFPDRLHAYVWRNWPLVPAERLARVVGAPRSDLLRLGESMGLSKPPPIPAAQQRRSYLTVIRRNWHLLPYEQLLQLLEWTPEQMAFTLREDDFLYIKLGSLKPKCAPLRYRPPDEATRKRAREIAGVVRREFPGGLGGATPDPLFGFVERLSRPLPAKAARAPGRASSRVSPRFCYSYFALYGDPLLEKEADPYPEGYLARLAASGVDGVWLQAVLYTLAPFPWDPTRSARSGERLKNLRALVARACRHGIGVYLYLNEPRALPLAFFERRPDLKGVVEGDHAALCTSHPDVRNYLADAVASVCQAVPDLAGLFTITASENLTNCWSHGAGASCPRCGKRADAEVIADVNRAIHEGMRRGGGRRPRLLVWDWGWPDAAADAIIAGLPPDAALMSVSEWSLPLRRGGVESAVGEYSLSAVGPGPCALRHWQTARKRGLKTVAKIQAANTWELSSVPYVPAVENAARHAANLRGVPVDGLMLGWTLGGYPSSPNLEVVAEIAGGNAAPERAMETVARRRFGPHLAPAVVDAWRGFSAAFREFPYHIGVVYNAPLQMGPANLLWEEPTGYRATMIGFPYDDLDTWRAVYPPETFIAQLQKVSDGFDRAVAGLEKALPPERERAPTPEARAALREEIDVATAAALHFRSAANQARFVLARRTLAAAKNGEEARPLLRELERALIDEIALARRLQAIQSRDGRIGFEASNQYFYVPVDLGEKVLNAHDLLNRWLPSQRAKFGANRAELRPQESGQGPSKRTG